MLEEGVAWFAITHWIHHSCELSLEQIYKLDCSFLSDGQSKGWNGLQIHGIGYLLIPHYFVAPMTNPFKKVDTPTNPIGRQTL